MPFMVDGEPLLISRKGAPALQFSAVGRAVEADFLGS